jgi:F0F1-type ATP synthase assembly protein I
MAISRENLQLIGQLSTVGFAFVFAIVLGFGGGYLLDGWLGTKPWFSFLGFFLGLAAGVLNVYRIMQLAQPPKAPKPPKSPKPPNT